MPSDPESPIFETDDEPVDDERQVEDVAPEVLPPTSDPEVPEPDALDQAREVEPGERIDPRMSLDPEVPEADAIEQRFMVEDPAQD